MGWYTKLLRKFKVTVRRRVLKLTTFCPTKISWYARLKRISVLEKNQSLQKRFYLISTSLPCNIPSQRFVSKHPLPGNIAATKILSSQVVIERSQMAEIWSKKSRDVYFAQARSYLFVWVTIATTRRLLKLDGYKLFYLNLTSLPYNVTSQRFMPKHTLPQNIAALRFCRGR